MIESFPLSWPQGQPRTKYPKKSAFKVGELAPARDLALAEIKRIRGYDAIVSTNIALRKDGLPYSGMANPKDAGVAIYFKKNKAPGVSAPMQMVFACDQYQKVQENLIAIAKTIEALRGIQRWGSSEMMERAFTGFLALPAPPKPRDWWEVLGVQQYARVDDVVSAFRALAKQAHPDVGGSNEQMAELNRAFADFKSDRNLP